MHSLARLWYGLQWFGKSELLDAIHMMQIVKNVVHLIPLVRLWVADVPLIIINLLIKILLQLKGIGVGVLYNYELICKVSTHRYNYYILIFVGQGDIFVGQGDIFVGQGDIFCRTREHLV